MIDSDTIPPEIHKAANDIHEWTVRNGVGDYWEFGNICSRKWASNHLRGPAFTDTLEVVLTRIINQVIDKRELQQLEQTREIAKNTMRCYDKPN